MDDNKALSFLQQKVSTNPTISMVLPYIAGKLYSKSKSKSNDVNLFDLQERGVDSLPEGTRDFVNYFRYINPFTKSRGEAYRDAKMLTATPEGLLDEAERPSPKDSSVLQHALLGALAGGGGSMAYGALAEDSDIVRDLLASGIGAGAGVGIHALRKYMKNKGNQKEASLEAYLDGYTGRV